MIQLPVYGHPGRSRCWTLACWAVCLVLAGSTPAFGKAPLAQAPEKAADVEPLWDLAWLPVGFHLDLATGVVGSRAPEGGPGLVYDGAALNGFDGMVELLTDAGGAQRPGQKPLEGLGARVGAACAFRLAGGRWGRIGVTAVDERAVTLEYLLAAPGATEVVRDPPALTLADRDGGLEVSWPLPKEVRGGMRWSVLARYHHRSTGSFRTIQTEVGEPRWVDRSADGTEVIEYWVARIDGGANFGVWRRGVPGALDAADPIRLRLGSTINLLTGEVDGARGDCRVSYLSVSAMHLEPLNGTRVFSRAKGGKQGGWEVPSVADAQYRDQRTSLMAGGSLVFHLPEGIYANIVLDGFGQNEALIRRQVDLGGGRIFPAPPAPPSVDRQADGSFRLSFAPLPRLGDLAHGVVLVLETEERDGSWRETCLSAPGERVLHLPADGARAAGGEGPAEPDVLALVRCRTRHRLATGLTSTPGELIEILPADDGSQAAATAILDRALSELAEGEFTDRRRAQRVLELLGPRAFQRLEAVLGSGNPDLAAAVQEVLIRSRRASSGALAAGKGEFGKPGVVGAGPSGTGPGGGAAAILLARARVLGIESAPPDGWTDDDPLRRALALLRAHGVEGNPERDTWRDVMAESDPDPTLRQLAVLLGSAGVEPPNAVIPWGRWRPDAATGSGRGPEPISWAEFFADQADVAELDLVFGRLAGEVSVAELRAAATLLTVAHDLWSSSRAWDGRREAFERAELALRLVERYQARGGPVLLEAARELTADPGAEIRAWRDLARLWLARGRAPGQGGMDENVGMRSSGVESLVLETLPADGTTGAVAGGATRQVIRIEGGPQAGAELVAALRNLADAGREDVDLVLGPGIYEAEMGTSSILVEVPGLHIIGDGDGAGVELRSGLHVTGARGVVFENLDILASETTALILTQAEARLSACRLRGRDTCLMMTDSDLFLDGCEILPPTSRRLVYGVRSSGRGMLIARDSLLAAGSVSLLGETRGFLERCVISAGQRNAIEGGRTGRVVLVDCLLQGEMAGLSNLSETLLDGVVSRCDRGLIHLAQGPVRVCPDHVLGLSTSQANRFSFSEPERLARCPLWR